MRIAPQRIDEDADRPAGGADVLHLAARQPIVDSAAADAHQLNNQLGIILAHAELLESKATDDMNRARAAQVVASALEAMGTAKEIRAFQNQLPTPNL